MSLCRLLCVIQNVLNFISHPLHRYWLSSHQNCPLCRDPIVSPVSVTDAPNSTVITISYQARLDDATTVNPDPDAAVTVPDRLGFPISEVYLSVLRSSLPELFLQQSNLTLATMFGQTSLFEILKFPLGTTVIPEKYVPFWTFPQILFNFTLNNSIYEIKEHLADLKKQKQLKLGLRLRPYENVNVQITNRNGSTIDPPFIVQAYVKSDLGSLSPERLKQLTLSITRVSLLQRISA